MSHPKLNEKVHVPLTYFSLMTHQLQSLSVFLKFIPGFFDELCQCLWSSFMVSYSLHNYFHRCTIANFYATAESCWRVQCVLSKSSFQLSSPIPLVVLANSSIQSILKKQDPNLVKKELRSCIDYAQNHDSWCKSPYFRTLKNSKSDFISLKV